MNFRELTKVSRSQMPSIILDATIPIFLRRFLRKLLILATVTCLFLSLSFSPIKISYSDILFFVFLILIFIAYILEAFYNSSRFSLARSRIDERGLNPERGCEYSVAKILYKTEDVDITKGFLSSHDGRMTLLRSGIPNEEVDKFLSVERSLVIDSSLVIESDYVSLKDYALAIYDADKSFSSFLSVHSISKDEFAGAAQWTGDLAERHLLKKRWWGQEFLDSVSSLGTSWSYGSAYELGKYGVDFRNTFDMANLGLSPHYREKEVALLEGVLARTAESNALLVDDEENVAKDIIGRLLKKIENGSVLSSIEHKKIVSLDSNLLLADKKSKAEFEIEFIKILNEVTNAGNIILYIGNFPSFIASGKQMGVSVPSLLEDYLNGSSIQLLAHSTVADFHFFIETNPALLQKFERIVPEETGVNSSVPVLKEKVKSLERKFKVIFSYPALLSITVSADRYITYGEMPGKAIDLLTEVAPWAHSNKIHLVGKNDVDMFLSSKTGIPMGEMTEAESEKLSHLEDILHRRIIGQDEAVKAVGNGMRRARSGITNPKRPFASFLFLGPTGVGKTETTKALAQNFFGGEDKIIRLDMSEYNGADALPRLIGSFGENRTGVLASKLRDNPYGVLLLDEFEKSSPDVLDLFLQILDEGIFTDALGKHVGCRNLIIIATSNAGGNLIWKIVEEGRDITKETNTIIDSIVKEGVYKPELLNRFDGVVIFHPLKSIELREVAKLGLEKLAKQLKEEKEIIFLINDELLDYLASVGSDEKFGGRAINRVIQDKVEDVIAKRIISGELKSGSSINLRREDLE